MCLPLFHTLSFINSFNLPDNLWNYVVFLFLFLYRCGGPEPWINWLKVTWLLSGRAWVRIQTPWLQDLNPPAV